MTAQPPQKDPILTRFCTALDEIYGPRIERVVLFGSRACGDAGPDSDYDVAVFLRDMPDRIVEMNRLADLKYRHSRRDRRVHPRMPLSRGVPITTSACR